MHREPYVPASVFRRANEPIPRVLVSPQRYIQGPGVINHTGRYLSLIECKRAAVLASARGHTAQGAQVADSLKAQGIDSVKAQFNGECSKIEIETHAEALAGEKLDCLIAVGGGKLVDAGKSIAWRLDIPVVIVPTLASNDAPCSSVSVIYTPEGSKDFAEQFPQNPAIVIVDTQVVAEASERYLVAGMGDAMATWYEARVCLENPQATTILGTRPTLAAYALGETCAHTLFEHGEQASRSVIAGEADEPLEKVVEANTLLSGVGFESGGLALAHGIAIAFPEVERVHHNHLHGEMVAMGLMTQLIMEQSQDLPRVAEFFARVGLPVHLEQLSLAPRQRGDLDQIIEATLENAITHNMPMPVDHASIMDAVLKANDYGRSVQDKLGDEAFRRIQA